MRIGWIQQRLDASDPTKLHLIGQPTNSGGEFPVSVTISSKTGQVCILIGGKVNELVLMCFPLSCFKQNGAAGLAAIPHQVRSPELDQTTPATGPAGSVSQVAFNEDKSKLFVAVKGFPGTKIPGYIAIWDVDARIGALSLIDTNLTKIPGKNSVIIADTGIGYNIIDFTHNTRATYVIANQTDTCWTVFSKQNGNAYIVDEGVKTVTEVNFDTRNVVNSSIVKQYKFTANLLDTDIASIHGTDYLYVFSVGSNSVEVLSLAEGLVSSRNMPMPPIWLVKDSKPRHIRSRLHCRLCYLPFVIV
ncbi:hypothetical protein M422DRAFT_68867 [Sphaerobolus stellatus SS14]|uniref:Methanethiol oxidase n=1 Tax=Sphaerobolus stellatus (strain SS14) TaxID=990650 RepID=A0A0C9VNP8_SPHS4|nr:hypothetical protein M422DRAFT_68867 [Sphaerobolus stellatus SS14]